MQSTIRQDKSTGQWVIYSRARSQRPHDYIREDRRAQQPPAHDPACPFCPGNEAALGHVVLELPAPGDPGWSTRVIPNKFPALTPEGDTAHHRDAFYLYQRGHGRHEVFIESPRHDRDLAAMSHAELAAVVESYHRRYLAYHREHGGMHAIIFRNHGPRAGTSLIHPHSQAIVTPVVPRQMRQREYEAQRYMDRHGRCLYCDMMAFEAREQSRVVADSGHFLCLVPYAAEVPCELWLMPWRHGADFGEINDEQKADLADTLGAVLRRLAESLGDPDYNLVIVTAARFRRREPGLHWFVRIRPRLTTRAGFEVGSGMSINPSLPEDDAAFLRGEVPILSS